MGSAHVDTRPVGPDALADLAKLFSGARNTRRCWCMAFCSTTGQFATGWLTGGNRRRFETAAVNGDAPMGLLAFISGEPIGWCALGPRSRYTVAEAGRSKLLRDRDRDEDEVVWLLPCLFVRPDHRSQGVTHALARAAIELARGHGALAIEGWPITGSERRSADAFVGRQELFDDLGFRCLRNPAPERAIMRLELNETARQQP